MHVVTARGKIRAAPARFAAAYDKKLHWISRHGKTRDEVVAALLNLNLDTCSAEDVDDIIGGAGFHGGWGNISCDICGKDADKLVVLNPEAYSTTHACGACLDKAVSTLTGHDGVS